MELDDFGLVNASAQDMVFLNKMKMKLNHLTGREYIENDWNDSKFGVKEQSQFRLCYNHLLNTCSFAN